VKDAVALLRQQRSVLVVAHRAVDCARCRPHHRDGARPRCCESGSHEALAASNGIYARLLSSGADTLTN
jgi:ABC-type multidrug transport system fused ATPase/permease subunit